MKRPALLTTLLAVGIPMMIVPAVASRPGLSAPPQRSGAAQSRTYTNPLPVEIADPCVLKHEGTYYLYGTSAPSSGFIVWTSRDLVNWERRGFAFHKTDTSWGRDHFWAPCVIAHRGAFYLYYNAVGRLPSGQMSHRICAARADSPLGPFTDVRAPMLDTGSAAIDAEVFVDEDGHGYLYYAKDISENPVSEIWGIPLSDDLLEPAGKPVRCLHPSQAWEGGRWNEAPCVFRQGNVYVMTYSARCFADPLYSIGYATSASPLGPWTKAGSNPLVRRTDDVCGPGHNCVTRSPDGREMMILYHTHVNPEGGCQRQLAMDRLTIAPSTSTALDGGVPSVRLSVNGPTHTAQPLPSDRGRVPEPVYASTGNE